MNQPVQERFNKRIADLIAAGAVEVILNGATGYKLEAGGRRHYLTEEFVTYVSEPIWQTLIKDPTAFFAKKP